MSTRGPDERPELTRRAFLEGTSAAIAAAHEPVYPDQESRLRALAAKGNPFAQMEVDYMDLPYEERAGIHFAPFLPTPSP